MAKIHLLLKKEEIDKEKNLEDKIAVVFDILLATSTITAALTFGAAEVIPVQDGDEARKEGAGRVNDSYILSGEYEGKTIDGFLSPNPLSLKGAVLGKTVILSTTNGTVAIRNSSSAKSVYAASLMNSQAVAEHILELHQNETILLICSGSSGEFNIEDFFGAGHFIDCLLKKNNKKWDLTDAAKAAYLFYCGNSNKAGIILKESRVGRMLSEMDFEEEIEFTASKNIFQSVPLFKDNRFCLP
ncbi:2-phosphosulfolactate phosphatase [Bacillus sp. OV322]|uniref:2-phosphosulfolactate phosphatase n=1 Tax=Bacillus sp. OV322 TaxID=1882764 RepID=UPI0008E23E49|nr:2-phosphosulfolactate phosphatase [Bacillus sp. OV322]SFC68422.1 2-phosphosulfolactate phosphatase [Bacillus sp. OV322]